MNIFTLSSIQGNLTNNEYWILVKQKARELKSDGCSGVADFYIDACYEHDIHYRTWKTVLGQDITKAQADWLLGVRIRQMATKNLDWNPRTWGNLLGYPMSIWRWLGVSVFGGASWHGDDSGSPFGCPKDDQSLPPVFGL